MNSLKKLFSVVLVLALIMPTSFANATANNDVGANAKKVQISTEDKQEIDLKESSSVKKIETKDDEPETTDPVAAAGAGVNCITFYSTTEFYIWKNRIVIWDGTLQSLAGNPAGTDWQTVENTDEKYFKISSAEYNGVYYLSLRGHFFVTETTHQILRVNFLT